ncbi:hypothetical protein HanRHA438_Chr02g0082411 [Helianthus annuus]|nr:hypothetical protein HanRHA438_Chr02g0082411 [Helianthus annuus]
MLKLFLLHFHIHVMFCPLYIARSLTKQAFPLSKANKVGKAYLSDSLLTHGSNQKCKLSPRPNTPSKELVKSVRNETFMS